MNWTLIGISLAYSVMFSLLYTRRKKWNTEVLRWTVTGSLFAVGMVGWTGKIQVVDPDFHFFSWCLMTPLFYNLLDRSFKKISEWVYQRDFYLWLRFSDDIDDSMRGINLHIRPLDILFSLILIFVIFFLPVLETLLF